jgi:ankyrin repeat protein/tetratricopeptide (TPR) repeat protein
VRILAGVMCLLLWPARAPAQQADWEGYMHAGITAYQQGNYPEAVKQIEAALRLAEAFGPNDRRLDRTLSFLARLYHDQGRYGNAEVLYKRVLAIEEKTLESDHPGLSTTLNALAENYYAQGRYAEAEPLFQRALAIREEVMNPENESLARTLSNLALVYAAQGKFAKAEPLFQRALAITKKKKRSLRNPTLAQTLNNLALLYAAQGKYAEAEPLFQRALVMREGVLGTEHPDVATSLEDYAAMLRKTGRTSEAARVEVRAKAIRTEVLQGQGSISSEKKEQAAPSSCMKEYFTKLKFPGPLVPLNEGQGRWEVAMEPSTTSDKITFYACLPSELVSKGQPDREPPSLFVICGIGVIDVAAIVTVDYGVKKNTHVLMKFDRAEPETATWKITRDKKAIIAPMTGGEFAKKLMMHDVLSVQLTLRHQKTVEFTYDLQGSASSLNLLGQACKWDQEKEVKPESKDRAAIIEERLARGGDINAKDENGWTLLHEAAHEGDIELVEMLLAKGADVNVKNDAGLTPLYYAVQENNATTELLLAKGADVGVRNASGQTVLHTAAEAGNTDVVEILLAKGADVNAKDKHDFTPLHLAVGKGYSGVAEVLLANGALVNAKDKNGWTALSYAVLNSNAAMVELLLSKGADVNVKDRNGETPMNLASDPKIRERLKQHADKK